MNRAAAAMSTLCTIAVAAISGGTYFFIEATRGGALTFSRAVAAVACLAIGALLLYLGHCRNMAPAAKTE